MKILFASESKREMLSSASEELQVICFQDFRGLGQRSVRHFYTERCCCNCGEQVCETWQLFNARTPPNQGMHIFQDPDTLKNTVQTDPYHGLLFNTEEH